jgi:hypothetical protein
MQDWLDTIDDLEVSPLETTEAGPERRPSKRPACQARSGSSAWSLTSVSASSSAGLESRTMPLPA